MSTESLTPYTLHGPLYVSSSKLMDGNHLSFQLHGVSTHGIAWYPQYINPETFRYLRDVWHVNCIRLAMYTAGDKGYQTGGDPIVLENTVIKGIDIASSLGMYVIVDWHVLEDEDPMVYKDAAIAFFDNISRKYGSYGNVLYEICNEPNGSGTWERIKTYASQVIPVIQRNAPYSVILVGTPFWCQEINRAVSSPIYSQNILYTMHFYAATHKQELRNRLVSALDAGLPVFISEFGICRADGDGAIDPQEGDAWKAIIDRFGLSFMCWNLSNKKEGSSLINARCPKLSGWGDNELTPQGRWFRNWVQSKPL